MDSFHYLTISHNLFVLLLIFLLPVSFYSGRLFIFLKHLRNKVYRPQENLFKELEKLDDLNPIELEMGDIIVFELVHLINKEIGVQSVLLDARQVKVRNLYHNLRKDRCDCSIFEVSLTQWKNELCYGLVKEEDAIIDPLILTMVSHTR